MLRKLSLRNFQAHRRLDIGLDPGITTIVGPTDAGKSAVIRALLWLLTNQPAGNEFIRNGSKGTQVTLDVDGHKVSRIRGKANLYKLDGKAYRSFGHDVPPEIAGLLKTGELNTQSQHDAPFWFSDSPGEVSRKLNSVVDLSTIDKVLSAVSAHTRRTKALTEANLANLRACREECRGLRNLASLEACFASLKRSYEDWRESHSAPVRLSAALSDVMGAKAGLRNAARFIIPSGLAQAAARYESAHEARVALEMHLRQVRGDRERLRHLSKRSAVAHKQFHQQTHNKRCPLCQHKLK